MHRRNGCLTDRLPPIATVRVGEVTLAWRCPSRHAAQLVQHRPRGDGPEEGPEQADQVPHEAAHAAVCEGERLLQRYSGLCVLPGAQDPRWTIGVLSLSSMPGDPLGLVLHHAAERALNTPKMF